jgi:hypothetical protein
MTTTDTTAGGAPALAEQMTAALAATGPNAAHTGALALYGRLVGAWDVTNRYLVEEPPGSADGHWETGTVLWTFGWVLAGNAVQDVMWFTSDGPRRRTATGSTMRLYDPAKDAWHIVWFSPDGTTKALTGRPGPGGDIVQEGTDAHGRPIRWSFTEMTGESFRWLGEVSDDGGQTWRLDQEMLGRRRAG